MTAARASALDDVGTFLAHALALETEAQERHEELARVMEVHNNEAAAAIFRKLAGYGAQHAAEVRAMLVDMAAPRLAPWDYDWGAAEAPERPSAASCRRRSRPPPRGRVRRGGGRARRLRRGLDRPHAGARADSRGRRPAAHARVGRRGVYSGESRRKRAGHRVANQVRYPRSHLRSPNG